MRHWGREAGRSALKHFKQVEVEWKDGGSLVTEADRAIERSLREKIKATFPNDAIIGEEFDDLQREHADWHWYLDPIDGTAAFSMGLPVWSVSISAWSDQRQLGLVWAPYIREEYWMDKNRNVHKNGKRLRYGDHSPTEWNSQTLLCIPSTSHRKYEIKFPGKCRSLGSTAYHMALVIDGRAVAALMGAIHIWDIAAAMAMGNQLGYVLRTIGGREPNWRTIRDGGTPRRPLLFGPPEAVDRLTDDIKLISESF